MEFIKTIDAIKWKDGNYEKTEEKTVEDEYAGSFKNLCDFFLFHCLNSNNLVLA